MDAHMPQPGFSEANWPVVRPLIASLLTKDPGSSPGPGAVF